MVFIRERALVVFIRERDGGVYPGEGRWGLSKRALMVFM